MSIKRRVLLLAGTAATAGTILAGGASAANAAPTHTLNALINICLDVPSLGTTKCNNLGDTTVVLADTNPVTRTVDVSLGQFSGSIQVKYQMDASGVVRHQLAFAKLLKNGHFVTGVSNVQATIVKTGATPSQVSGVGSSSGGGATITDGATTQIIV